MELLSSSTSLPSPNLGFVVQSLCRQISLACTHVVSYSGEETYRLHLARAPVLVVLFSSSSLPGAPSRGALASCQGRLWEALTLGLPLLCQFSYDPCHCYIFRTHSDLIFVGLHHFIFIALIPLEWKPHFIQHLENSTILENVPLLGGLMAPVAFNMSFGW